MTDTHIRPDARCPVRPGEPCTLCQLDVAGPQDCPLVYLVMNDADLREQLRATTARAMSTRPAGDGPQTPET